MNYTKYERARIIGARALQIGMGAPFLLTIAKEELEKIKYNPIEIAKMEFSKGLVPITVKRELPRPEHETPQKKVRKLFEISEVPEEPETEPQSVGPGPTEEP